MFSLALAHPSIKKIVGFALLAVNLILLGVMIKLAARDFPIWFFGEISTGIVEDKWYDLLEQESNEFNANYFLQYSFEAPDGSEYTGSTQMSAIEWSAQSIGDPITITYAPSNPANNRVDDTRFVPLMLCSYIPVFILIWILTSSGISLLKDAFEKPEEKPWLTDKLSI